MNICLNCTNQTCWCRVSMDWQDITIFLFSETYWNLSLSCFWDISFHGSSKYSVQLDSIGGIFLVFSACPCGLAFFESGKVQSKKSGTFLKCIGCKDIHYHHQSHWESVFVPLLLNHMMTWKPPDWTISAEGGENTCSVVVLAMVCDQQAEIKCGCFQRRDSIYRKSFVWFCVCVLLERGLAHDKVKFVINSVETVLQKSVLCSLSRDKFMDAVSCACL